MKLTIEHPDLRHAAQLEDAKLDVIPTRRLDDVGRVDERVLIDTLERLGI